MVMLANPHQEQLNIRHPTFREGHAVNEDRLKREADFHDHIFSEQARQPVAKYYAAAAGAKAHYQELVLRDCRDRSVLEYGCGTGSAAFDLARHGARVTAIDISPVGVQTARTQARELGLTDAITCRQMDVEQMEFPPASFDTVCGSGILHHVDLGVAVDEIRRVLKPDGRAVFFEPLAHNPLIAAYRKMTPRLRSIDEHPLTFREVRQIEAGFVASESRFFGLLVLAAVPLHGLPGFAPLRAMLDRLDRAVLRLPGIRGLAWIAVIHVQGITP